MPSVRSMMKNTTAQNVDPERVEIASGYRMKTKPAPEIEKLKDSITKWCSLASQKCSF